MVRQIKLEKNTPRVIRVPSLKYLFEKPRKVIKKSDFQTGCVKAYKIGK